MAERRDRTGRGIPRIRTDITPIIAEDTTARSAIERVRTAEDIDKFVRYLRERHFPRWLHYVPPLVISHPVLSKTIEKGMDEGLVTPDNFASTMWNQGFAHYPGVVNNIRAAFIPFNPHDASTFQPFIHRASVVSFQVQGDMISETGAVEGTARRTYVLYLDHLNSPCVIPQRWLGQALRFFSPDELRTKKTVYMATSFAKSGEVREIIHQAYERVKRSRLTAEGVQRQGLSHPFQGGLPGLGEASR